MDHVSRNTGQQVSHSEHNLPVLGATTLVVVEYIQDPILSMSTPVKLAVVGLVRRYE